MDKKDYKVGDKITVEIWRFNSAGNPEFKLQKGALDTGLNWLNLNKVEVLHHEPAPEPLKAGDRVRKIGVRTAHCATIQAIIGKKMWIKFDDAGMPEVIRDVEDYEILKFR